MHLGQLIVPLGLLTYTMALITVVSGLRQVKIQNHKLLALITIILATLHAGLIIYLKFF